MASGSSSELDWAMEVDSTKRKSVSFVDEKVSDLKILSFNFNNFLNIDS